MGKTSGKKPTWFKMFSHQRALIDAVSDEAAGKALKAAFRYFDSNEIDDNMEPMVFAVFSTIKPYIDEAFQDYKRSVEYGRMGGKCAHQINAETPSAS